MARVALTSGAYTARSVVAAAQRSLNLFGEALPTGNQYTGATGLGEPAQYSFYPTPGTRLLGTLPAPIVNGGGVRGIRQATTGGVYAVVQDGVYRVHSDWTGTLLGHVTGGRQTPVSMMDNGLQLVIVDGSTNGWAVTLADDSFAPIVADGFYGADKVDYLDTFFVFNKPGTPQFYYSGSLSIDFDPLDFANKESFSDLLTTLVVCRREIWLLGERTTEVWNDVGATDIGPGSSQFAQVGGVFIEHGTRAKYSVANNDDAIFWLTYDRSGGGMVFMGAQYKTTRISTHAIEAALGRYSKIEDAIGFFYSLGGHVCYVLTFPTADATWVYDTQTHQWHEWCWLDPNGEEHRHRGNCCYAINGVPVVGDWQNGNLYALDLSTYTDNGQPIKRQRAFPHMMNDANRVFYRQFIADLETGTDAGTLEAISTTPVFSTFTAPDGTALEDYAGEAGTWTALTPGEVIEGERLVGDAGTSPLYQSGPISTPDYSVDFRAVPSAWDTVPDGALVYAIGRAVNGGAGGYRLSVAGDGAQYQMTLAVLGGASTTMPLGALTTNGAFLLTLAMQGTTIVARVRRSADRLWLRSDGAWVADEANAISMTDATWAVAGAVMIGGAW